MTTQNIPSDQWSEFWELGQGAIVERLVNLCCKTEGVMEVSEVVMEILYATNLHDMPAVLEFLHRFQSAIGRLLTETHFRFSDVCPRCHGEEFDTKEVES